MSTKYHNSPEKSTHHHQITKHVGGFGLATLLSRILGYARDAVMAHVFGNSLAADAFFAAYRIPNLWRRLLGEGALTASFVPTYTEYLKTKPSEETEDFLNSTFTYFSIVLVGIVVLGIIFAPLLTKLITAGFGRIPGKLELTTTLTRVMFPYLLFVCLAAFLAGILNSHRRFFISALSPAALSVVDLIYMLFLVRLAPNPIFGLAVAVTIGGFFQCGLQGPAVYQQGIRFRFCWKPGHPGLVQIRRLMLPAMMGISVDQINAFVDTVCASFLKQGSVTALYYSNRLMQLPLALFGIAAASVTLPVMSASFAQKNVPEMKETLNFALRMVLFLLLPAMTGLIVCGRPIVQLLFERGAFTAEGTSDTYQALLFYSTGLAAYGSVRLLASAFYSMKDTKTPVKAAGLAMVLNVFLNVSLMRYMGVGGLALATALASLANAFYLLRVLRHRLGLLGGKKMLNTFLQTSVCSIAMGSVCWGILQSQQITLHPVLILPTIGLGAAVYFLAARLLKMEEQKTLMSLLAR